MQTSVFFTKRREEVLVWHVPNLGRTPAFQALNLVSEAMGASILYNLGLAGVLDALSNDPQLSIEIVQFDAFTGVEKIINPAPLRSYQRDRGVHPAQCAAVPLPQAG